MQFVRSFFMCAFVYVVRYGVCISSFSYSVIILFSSFVFLKLCRCVVVSFVRSFVGLIYLVS